MRSLTNKLFHKTSFMVLFSLEISLLSHRERRSRFRAKTLWTLTRVFSRGIGSGRLEKRRLWGGIGVAWRGAARAIQGISFCFVDQDWISGGIGILATSNRCCWTR